MTRYQKLTASLLLLSATAFAGLALAAPPDIPRASKKGPPWGSTRAG